MLNNIKLTVTQWLVALTGLLIGGLVLALKIQGSRLHKARVDLLKKDIDISIEKEDSNVADKKKRYAEAKKAYKKGQK